MKIKALFFFVTLMLISMTAFATEPVERSVSPDGKNVVEWQCEDMWQKKCEVSAIIPNQKIQIWKEVQVLSATWHGNDLLEIHASCGSPCSYSRFYSPGREGSGPIEFVVARSAEKKIAISATGDYLKVIKIFENDQKPIQLIELKDYAPTAVLVNVIKEVKFLKGDKLLIRYLAGDDYIEKSKTVNLKFR